MLPSVMQMLPTRHDGLVQLPQMVGKFPLYGLTAWGGAASGGSFMDFADGPPPQAVSAAYVGRTPAPDGSVRFIADLPDRLA